MGLSFRLIDILVFWIFVQVWKTEVKVYWTTWRLRTQISRKYISILQMIVWGFQILDVVVYVVRFSLFCYIVFTILCSKYCICSFRGLYFGHCVSSLDAYVLIVWFTLFTCFLLFVFIL